MKKILLIGANGFLGSFLHRHLVHEGYVVKSLSRKGNNLDFQIDIAAVNAWQNITFEPEIIINCATVLPGGNMKDRDYAERIFHTNLWGTYQLCQWIDNICAVKYVLNISTLAVIKKPWPVPLTENAPTYPTGPHALYSASKLNQELILSSYPFKHQPKIVHARLSALFGEHMPWNGILSYLIDKSLYKEKISLINGNKVSVDLLYVRDACFYLADLISNETEGVINIASGNELFLVDLAKEIAGLVGVSMNMENQDQADSQDSRAVIDISKLKAISTHRNTSLNLALKDTIDYRGTLMSVHN